MRSGSGGEFHEGDMMKYYFLVLATLVVVCVGCSVVGDGQQTVHRAHQHYAPPAHMLTNPGPMVDGPGPGVLAPLGPPAPRAFATTTTQVRFIGPAGMHIGWLVPDGWAEDQLIAPGRYNFPQAATYRLKLSEIPNRPGLALYPTLQIYPSHPTTDAYLSHSSVPIEITDEDIDQVTSNNFVTKVIYLPDPRFQELAVAGVETLVSTRLDPGIDPVFEADRRGTVMAVLRMGNTDLEMPAPIGVGPAAPAVPNDEQGAGILRDGNLLGVGHEEPRTVRYVPPMPMEALYGAPGVPPAMIAGVPGLPGQVSVNPVSGVNGTPTYGLPSQYVGTPIGLAGPPHLPLGRPASLKSHTVRNRTPFVAPKPVDHFLVDVSQSPRPSVPKPVRRVEYHESHPTFRPGELSYPAHMLPQQGAPPYPQPQSPHHMYDPFYH